MAYGVHYRISYLRFSGGRTTIDILEKNYNSTVVDLQAAGDPLSIEWESSPTGIFDPTLGTGCTIKVVEPPFTLEDLYTEDPLKFKVNIFHGPSENDGDASSGGDGVLIWQGYVSPELFEEDYWNSINTTIVIHCNDGLTTLDCIPYKTIINTYHYDRASLGEIINRCLDLVELSFKNVYFLCNGYQYEAGLYNLFTGLGQIQENFIDESGEAMTCRKVLDTIIGGLGFVFFFEGRNIYIIDPIELHNKVKGKKFEINFASYIQEDIGGYLDISSGDIVWKGTGMKRTIFPGRSQIKLNYNPYTKSGFDYNFADAGNKTEVGSFAAYNVDGACYYNSNVTFKDWANNGGHLGIGIKEAIGSTPEFGICLNNSGGIHTWSIPLSSINEDSNLQIKISLNAFVLTRTVGNSPRMTVPNIYHGDGGKEINKMYIPVRIKVGSHYCNINGEWTLSTTDTYFGLKLMQEGVTDSEFATNNHNSKINDTWVSGNIFLTLSDSIVNDYIHGLIEVTILDYIDETYYNIDPDANKNFIHYVLIKDVSVTFLDKTSILWGAGKPVSNEGKEYKGYSDPTWVGRQSMDMAIDAGTGICGVSRGAYIQNDNSYPKVPITGLLDGGASKEDTSKIILKGVVAQFKKPRDIITGRLDALTYSLSLRHLLIKDTNFRGTKAFYVYKGNYIDVEEVIDVEMIELTDTKDTIA